MSHLPLDARAILHYLNDLGYRNISAEQLKEFLKGMQPQSKNNESKKYNQQLLQQQKFSSTTPGNTKYYNSSSTISVSASASGATATTTAAAGGGSVLFPGVSISAAAGGGSTSIQGATSGTSFVGTPSTTAAAAPSSKVVGSSFLNSVKIIKSRKPLCQFKFYLDICDHQVTKKVEEQIKSLGGILEFFLNSSVTHFITDKSDLVQQQQLQQQQLVSSNNNNNSNSSSKPGTPQTPATPGTPKTPYSLESYDGNNKLCQGTPVGTKRARASRADAILNRARRQQTQTPTTTAKRATPPPVGGLIRSTTIVSSRGLLETCNNTATSTASTTVTANVLKASSYIGSTIDKTQQHYQQNHQHHHHYQSNQNHINPNFVYIIWHTDYALRFFKKVQYELRDYLIDTTAKESSAKTKLLSKSLLVEPISLKGNFIKIEPIKRNYRPYYHLIKKPTEWPKIELTRDDGAFRLSPKKPQEDCTKLLLIANNNNNINNTNNNQYLNNNSNITNNNNNSNTTNNNKMTRKSRSRSSQHRPLPANVQALKKGNGTATGNGNGTDAGSPKASTGNLIVTTKNAKLFVTTAVAATTTTTTTNNTNTTLTTPPPCNKDIIKESSEKQCGVCEICKIEYDILSVHLKSKEHEYFAKNSQNFVALDGLINSSADVNKFLEENNKKLELEEMEVDELNLNDDNHDEMLVDPLKNPTPTLQLLNNDTRDSSALYKTPSPTLREKSKRSTKGKHSSEKFQKTDNKSASTNLLAIATCTATSTPTTTTTTASVGIGNCTGLLTGTGSITTNITNSLPASSFAKDSFDLNKKCTTSIINSTTNRRKPSSVLALSPPIRPMLPQSPLYKVVETSEMRTPKRKGRFGNGNNEDDNHCVASPSLIVKFQKVRQSELDRLNGEAENFMFRKQPTSSELPTDQDRQTTSDHSTNRLRMSSACLDSTSDAMDLDIENPEDLMPTVSSSTPTTSTSIKIGGGGGGGGNTTSTVSGGGCSGGGSKNKKAIAKGKRRKGSLTSKKKKKYFPIAPIQPEEQLNKKACTKSTSSTITTATTTKLNNNNEVAKEANNLNKNIEGVSKTVSTLTKPTTTGTSLSFALPEATRKSSRTATAIVTAATTSSRLLQAAVEAAKFNNKKRAINLKGKSYIENVLSDKEDKSLNIENGKRKVDATKSLEPLIKASSTSSIKPLTEDKPSEQKQSITSCLTTTSTSTIRTRRSIVKLEDRMGDELLPPPTKSSTTAKLNHCIKNNNKIITTSSSSSSVTSTSKATATGTTTTTVTSTITSTSNSISTSSIITRNSLASSNKTSPQKTVNENAASLSKVSTTLLNHPGSIVTMDDFEIDFDDYDDVDSDDIHDEDFRLRKSKRMKTSNHLTTSIITTRRSLRPSLLRHNLIKQEMLSEPEQEDEDPKDEDENGDDDDDNDDEEEVEEEEEKLSTCNKKLQTKVLIKKQSLSNINVNKIEKDIEEKLPRRNPCRTLKANLPLQSPASANATATTLSLLTSAPTPKTLNDNSNIPSILTLNDFTPSRRTTRCSQTKQQSKALFDEQPTLDEILNISKNERKKRKTEKLLQEASNNKIVATPKEVKATIETSVSTENSISTSKPPATHNTASRKSKKSNTTKEKTIPPDVQKNNNNETSLNTTADIPTTPEQKDLSINSLTSAASSASSSFSSSSSGSTSSSSSSRKPQPPNLSPSFDYTKSPLINNLRYAFERLPVGDLWYKVFSRQDDCKEIFCEYYGSTKYRKLPYELGPIPFNITNKGLNCELCSTEAIKKATKEKEQSLKEIRTETKSNLLKSSKKEEEEENLNEEKEQVKELEKEKRLADDDGGTIETKIMKNDKHDLNPATNNKDNLTNNVNADENEDDDDEEKDISLENVTSSSTSYLHRHKKLHLLQRYRKEQQELLEQQQQEKEQENCLPIVCKNEEESSSLIQAFSEQTSNEIKQSKDLQEENLNSIETNKEIIIDNTTITTIINTNSTAINTTSSTTTTTTNTTNNIISSSSYSTTPATSSTNSGGEEEEKLCVKEKKSQMSLLLDTQPESSSSLTSNIINPTTSTNSNNNNNNDNNNDNDNNNSNIIEVNRKCDSKASTPDLENSSIILEQQPRKARAGSTHSTASSCASSSATLNKKPFRNKHLNKAVLSLELPPRKSPREHASTLALVSCLIRQRQDSLSKTNSETDEPPLTPTTPLSPSNKLENDLIDNNDNKKPNNKQENITTDYNEENNKTNNPEIPFKEEEKEEIVKINENENPKTILVESKESSKDSVDKVVNKIKDEDVNEGKEMENDKINEEKFQPIVTPPPSTTIDNKIDVIPLIPRPTRSSAVTTPLQEEVRFTTEISENVKRMRRGQNKYTPSTTPNKLSSLLSTSNTTSISNTNPSKSVTTTITNLVSSSSPIAKSDAAIAKDSNLDDSLPKRRGRPPKPNSLISETPVLTSKRRNAATNGILNNQFHYHNHNNASSSSIRKKMKGYTRWQHNLYKNNNNNSTFTGYGLPPSIRKTGSKKGVIEYEADVSALKALELATKYENVRHLEWEIEKYLELSWKDIDMDLNINTFETIDDNTSKSNSNGNTTATTSAINDQQSSSNNEKLCSTESPIIDQSATNQSQSQSQSQSQHQHHLQNQIQAQTPPATDYFSSDFDLCDLLNTNSNFTGACASYGPLPDGKQKAFSVYSNVAFENYFRKKRVPKKNRTGWPNAQRKKFATREQQRRTTFLGALIEQTTTPTATTTTTTTNNNKLGPLEELVNDINPDEMNLNVNLVRKDGEGNDNEKIDEEQEKLKSNNRNNGGAGNGDNGGAGVDGNGNNGVIITPPDSEMEERESAKTPDDDDDDDDGGGSVENESNSVEIDMAESIPEEDDGEDDEDDNENQNDQDDDDETDDIKGKRIENGASIEKIKNKLKSSTKTENANDKNHLKRDKIKSNAKENDLIPPDQNEAAEDEEDLDGDEENLEDNDNDEEEDEDDGDTMADSIDDINTRDNIDAASEADNEEADNEDDEADDDFEDALDDHPSTVMSSLHHKLKVVSEVQNEDAADGFDVDVVPLKRQRLSLDDDSPSDKMHNSLLSANSTATSTPTNHLLRHLRRTPQLNGSLGSCISPSEKAGDNSDIFTVSSDGLETDLDLSNQHGHIKTADEDDSNQVCPHQPATNTTAATTGSPSTAVTPKRKLDITKYAPKNSASSCAAEAATAAVKSLAISQFLKKEVRVTCRRLRAPFRRFRFRR